jgi:hypothetical protein
MMIQGVSDSGPDGATIRTTTGTMSGALMGTGFYPAMGGVVRPRSGTGAVAGSDRCSRRGGGAVLAQARRGGGDPGAGGGAGGGADSGAVEEVFRRG